MALKYSNVGGSKATGFAIDTSDGSFTDVVLGSSFPAGGYQVTSVNGNQNLFVFFGGIDGSPAGGTAGKSIIATKEFNKVTIINAEANDLITFEYKETSILDTIGASSSYSGAIISSFSPNEISNIDDVVTITGAAFSPSVEVTFSGSNGIAVPAKAISRISDTQLLVTRPDSLSGIQDPHRITVQNPGINPPVSTNIDTDPIYAGQAPEWITAQALPAFTKGETYSTIILATDPDETQISYSLVSGSLPVGLSYNPINSTISGTPTAATSAQFTIRATEASGRYSDRVFQLPNAYPVFTTPTTLPPYTKDIAYSATVSATDDSGMAPGLSVVGSLPTGLSLNQLTGEIHGIVSDNVDKTLTIRATDTNGTETDLTFTLPNAAPIWVTPSGVFGEYGVGTVFSKTLVATDDGTIQYSVVSGSLPAGLSLNQTTGTISGTPTVSVAEGTSTGFTVRALDNAQKYADRYFSLVANVAPVWVTPAGSAGYILDAGTSIQLSATNGLHGQSITYSVVSGSLPTGISLNSNTGIISGSSNLSDGTVTTFTVRATDAVGLYTDREFSVIKNSVPVWTTPAGVVTKATVLTATSGSIGGAITYSVVEGELPTGTTLTSAGAFVGNPTTNATYNFTVRATDSQGTYSDRAFSAVVVNAQLTDTYSYTGAVQTFIAPATSIAIDLYGAQGGRSGGLGGRVTGTLTATVGQTIYVYVGGQGLTGNNAAGGFNGGGQAGSGANDEGSGGGATDIRTSASTDSRLAVAGGGGGSGGLNGGTGGSGGGASGNQGNSGQGQGGFGGTSTGPGNGGYPNGGSWGSAGSGAIGGTGGSSYQSGGGGGGGGFFGGGGGGADIDPCCTNGAGGGGGSGWTNTTYVANTAQTIGSRAGNGLATFSYLGKSF